MSTSLLPYVAPDAPPVFAHYMAPHVRAKPSWRHYESILAVRLDFLPRVDALWAEAQALEDLVYRRNPSLGRIRSSVRREQMLTRARLLARAGQEADWTLWRFLAPEMRERLDHLFYAVANDTFTFSPEFIQHHTHLRHRRRMLGCGALPVLAAAMAGFR